MRIDDLKARSPFITRLFAMLFVALCLFVSPMQVQAASGSVSYRTHVQSYGWQGWKKNGQMSGTTGKAKRLEGINIKLGGVSGGITYRAHVQTYGWQGWKKNGQMAGTTGQSKRLEAIQIKLTGNAAKQYDVYYRVHVQKLGWLGWAKNGESAGSTGYGYRLEGIQIKLVKKGSSAPGTRAKIFYKKGTGAVNGATAGSSGSTNTTGSVYVTSTGECYHKRSCRTLSRSKNISGISVSAAKRSGYRACRVCHP